MWIEFRRHIPTTLKFNWVSAEPLEVSRTHLPKHIPNISLHIPSYSSSISLPLFLAPNITLVLHHIRRKELA